MKRLALSLALLLLSHEASAVGRSADVEVIDRDTGRPLPTYYHRGEYWVAGTPGARYGIQLRNHIGERVLAVMAVDGVNVVTGETAGWDQNGYVFAAHQAYDITGWRKSNFEVAQFVFARPADSYAARTGRGANVGVIGVALFREKYAPPPVAYAAPEREPSFTEDRLGAATRAAAPPAEAMARDKASDGALRSEAQGRTLAAPAPAPALGTGHGARENSYVENTEFTRRQSTPDEVIRIRYDSFDNLVAAGVVRRPAWTLPRPEAFPESRGEGFVPDPPGYSGGGLR